MGITTLDMELFDNVVVQWCPLTKTIGILKFLREQCDMKHSRVS